MTSAAAEYNMLLFAPQVLKSSSRNHHSRSRQLLIIFSISQKFNGFFSSGFCLYICLKLRY